MEKDDCPELRLNAAQALERLRSLTGLALSGRHLLALCRADLCPVHLDCSFAHGVVGTEQMLARRIRGIGYCQLLDGGEMLCDPAEPDGSPTLTVAGNPIVRGEVWVYATDQANPAREEGIWRMSLGAVPRRLYFRPEDLVAVAGRLRESRQRLPLRRASL